jgi:F0F1-type ATP synthase assembly protein I
MSDIVSAIMFGVLIGLIIGTAHRMVNGLG